MPKPNTRFLRNIIKDTDTHNKALLAKEAAESRARLKELEHAEDLKRRKTDPSARDIRRRQLGNIQSILGGKNTERRQDRRDHDRLSRNGHGDRKRDRASHSDETRRSRRRYHDSSEEEDEEEAEEEKRHRRDRARDRSRSPRRRRRSRSRSRSPSHKKSKHRHRSPVTEKDSPRRYRSKKDDDYSDPLEDLIGPAPPPKYRGRGKIAGSADMDRRFSDSYDPRTDTILEDDDEEKKKEKEDNWDDAVEAFRDRQKLRQKQEERMREAGFADHQIQKLNAYAERERTEEDVVWAKAGEKREWDRGKDGDEVLLRGILFEDQ